MSGTAVDIQKLFTLPPQATKQKLEVATTGKPSAAMSQTVSIEELLSSYQAGLPDKPPITPEKPLASTDPGSRILSLLSGSSTAPSEGQNHSSGPSIPGFVKSGSSGIPVPPLEITMTSPNPATKKKAKGRVLEKDEEVYDIDVRVPGEEQPQLEVSPITVYTSEFVLLPGRKIAVNDIYISYALKGANIRILNMNTALRALVKGHAQRITDMAFFSNKSNLLASIGSDGHLVTRTFTEETETNGDIRIHEHVELSLVIHGRWTVSAMNPQLCWHPTNQDVLYVAVGEDLFTLSCSKLSSSNAASILESPLEVHVDSPPVGIQVLEGTTGPICSLTTPPPGVPYLATPTEEGLVRVLDISNPSSPKEVNFMVPFVGNPVTSAVFLPSLGPESPIFMLTGSLHNRSLKLWASGRNQKLLTPWHHMQTLHFGASLSPPAPAGNPDDPQRDAPPPVFNQLAVLPAQGLVLLANAHRQAIYAVHLAPSGSDSWQMDYVSEFSVKLPVLSFVALPRQPVAAQEGKGGTERVEIFCVQTKSIQLYTLDLEACCPPPRESGQVAASDLLETLGPLPAPLPPAVARLAEPGRPPSTGAFGSPVEPSAPPLNPVSEPPRAEGSGLTLNPEPASVEGVQDLLTGSPAPPPAANEEGSEESIGEGLGEGSGEVCNAQAGWTGGSPGEAQPQLLTPEHLMSLMQGESVGDDGTVLSSSGATEPSAELSLVDSPEPLDREIGGDPAQLPVDPEPLEEQHELPQTQEEVKGSDPVYFDSAILNLSEGSGPAVPPGGWPSQGEPTGGVQGGASAEDLQKSIAELSLSTKELASRLAVVVGAPVAKEGKRLEASLGAKLEKSLRAHSEAQGARAAEEAARKERGERDRWEAGMGRVHEAVTSTLQLRFQNLLPEAEGMLEKHLDQALGRQLAARLEPLVKAAVQESLHSVFQASVIPAFESAMAAALKQMDSALTRGLQEHTQAANRRLEELGRSLQAQVASSVSSMASLKEELGETQKKLLSAVDSLEVLSQGAEGAGRVQGASPVLQKGLSLQQLEQVLDPTIELSRLLGQRKYEEAFTKALSLSKVATVTWLCKQVDAKEVFPVGYTVLSQGVLLSLIQQLSCELGKDTEIKLVWLKNAILVLNPSHPQLAPHMRAILKQMYQNLQALPDRSDSAANDLRLLIHVVNSLLLSIK